MIAYKQNSSPVKAGPARSGQPPVLVNNPILDQHAAAIKRLGKRITEDIIEIGRLLTESKEILGHGNFLPWVEHEFKWSASSVERFMQVYELSGKFVNLTNLEVPITGLYLLAAPSVPEEARNEVIERAEGGERITTTDLKAIINRYKNPETSAPKLPTSPILRPAWADGKPSAPAPNVPIAPRPDASLPVALPPPPPPSLSMPYPSWAKGNSVNPEEAAAERKALYEDEVDEDDADVDEDDEGRERFVRLRDVAEDMLLGFTLEDTNRYSKLYDLLNQVVAECETQLTLMDANQEVAP